MPFPRAKIETFGAAELTKRLEEFGPRTVVRILKTALRTGARAIAQAQRKAVPRGVRSAIGSRGPRSARGTRLTAKAGGGVGKPRTKIEMKRGKKRAGAGISATNIHWYTLGTRSRYTGTTSSGGDYTNKGGGRRSRKRIAKRTGHPRRYTGSMPSHSLRAAAMAASGTAMAVVRAAISKGIGREWEKTRKKASRF